MAHRDRECDAPARLTPAQGEGPNYKPDAPERTALWEPGIPGTRLIVSGRVLSRDCRPVAGALLDFWQADGEGHYDNVGYRLRGRQFTDAEGRYRLETVVPGGYGGRTPHIHVHVQAPNRPVIITQLYLPGGPGSQRDSSFDPELVPAIQDVADGVAATFDFVLDVR